MTNRFYIVLILALTLSCSKEKEEEVTKPTDDDYVLVFNDEFNYTGVPDPTKWDYELGFIRNNEPQLYQKENATVSDGNLIIEARKERVRNPFYKEGGSWYGETREYAEYTSSSLITLGKYDFKYGRVELRGKIDFAQGTWPAFWAMGVNFPEVGWPACGEVDIMEYFRRALRANFFWQGPNNSVKRNMRLRLIFNYKSWAEKYHIWRMDWDSNNIRLYVDDYLMNDFNIAQIKNGTLGNNPFRENFYLLINLALGQDGEFIPDVNIPSRYYVDYVRVYQKK